MSILRPRAMQTSNNWFNRNKTKLLGLGIITVSFIQQDQGLIELIGPELYAWIIRGAGLLALWFGFLNNPPSKVEE